MVYTIGLQYNYNYLVYITLYNMEYNIIWNINGLSMEYQWFIYHL